MLWTVVAALAGVAAIPVTIILAFVDTGPAGGTDAPPSHAGVAQPGPTPSASASARTIPPSPTASPSDSPSGGSSGALTYLSEVKAIRGAQNRDGTYKVGGETYEYSTQIVCSGTSRIEHIWDAAGYDSFTARIGIASSEDNGLGAVGVLSIKNQDDEDLIDPFEVTLSQTTTVDVPLRGAIQIVFVCAGRNTAGEPKSYFAVTLGGGAFRGRT